MFEPRHFAAQHGVAVVERRVGIGEVGAGVGAAALLAEERAAGDQPRERVRVVEQRPQPFGVALEPGAPVAPPPTRETRKAMWRHAGLERDADGLRPLLDDPHPLARLVARCALFREESRGAHARADFPDTDTALDGRHTVLDDADPRLETWA